MAYMDKERETTRRNHATHEAAMAAQRAKSAAIHKEHLARIHEFGKTYGNGKY